LTLEELILPVDFALPILEDYLKKQINIDDEPVLPPDLSKIKIIPSKRKKPEPTIPFALQHFVSLATLVMTTCKNCCQKFAKGTFYVCC
jgi:hypothetical protein